jgi:hypothetical protein
MIIRVEYILGGKLSPGGRFNERVERLHWYGIRAVTYAGYVRVLKIVPESLESSFVHHFWQGWSHYLLELLCADPIHTFYILNPLHYLRLLLGRRPSIMIHCEPAAQNPPLGQP